MTVLIILPFLILVLIGFAIHSTRKSKALQREREQLIREGVKTWGTVTGHKVKMNPTGHGTYTCYYVQFNAQSGRVAVTETVGSDRFPSYTRGQKIMVHYDPANPRKCVLATQAEREALEGGVALPWILVFFSIMIWLVVIWYSF